MLGHLALGMQNQAKGRLTQVSKGRAAEIVAPHLREVAEAERSGEGASLSGAGGGGQRDCGEPRHEVRFYQLTFQEYLAARAIAGLSEVAQQKLLLKGDRLYQPEWREVMLLLGGVLLVKQGSEKVMDYSRRCSMGWEGKPALPVRRAAPGCLGR